MNNFPPPDLLDLVGARDAQILLYWIVFTSGVLYMVRSLRITALHYFGRTREDTQTATDVRAYTRKIESEPRSIEICRPFGALNYTFDMSFVTISSRNMCSAGNKGTLLRAQPHAASRLEPRRIAHTSGCRHGSGVRIGACRLYPLHERVESTFGAMSL